MDTASERAIWRFREFELDERLCELRRAGRRVPLQRKPYQLLTYLIANRHRVVTRADLLGSVWQGFAVSDSALASALRDLRRALSDAGRAPWAIETVHGFGYRFVAQVEAGGSRLPGALAASEDRLDARGWALALRMAELLESVGIDPADAVHRRSVDVSAQRRKALLS